jgi:hypothetical protein
LNLSILTKETNLKTRANLYRLAEGNKNLDIM